MNMVFQSKLLSRNNPHSAQRSTVKIHLPRFFSPGAYEHNLRRNKKVNWHQSFGGAPIAMPEIKVRSIIDQNTSKVRHLYVFEH